jgi:hypothetical protein
MNISQHAVPNALEALIPQPKDYVIHRGNYLLESAPQNRSRVVRLNRNRGFLNTGAREGVEEIVLGIGNWQPYYFSNDPGAITPSGASVDQPFLESSYTVARIDNALQQIVNSWETRYGNNTGYADPTYQRDPATAQSELSAYAQQYCATHPAACQGVNVSSLISGLAQHYAQWFRNTFPRGWGDAFTAAGYSPQDYGSGWEPYNQNNIQVQALPWQQAPQQTQQVQPAQVQQPQPANIGPTFSQVVSSSGNLQTGAASGSSATEEVLGWVKDNALLLGVGVAALLILPGMIGKK